MRVDIFIFAAMHARFYDAQARTYAARDASLRFVVAAAALRRALCRRL